MSDVQRKSDCPLLNLSQKSKMAAKMAAMEATKTRPWDNTLGWEHGNSFSRPPEDNKNAR